MGNCDNIKHDRAGGTSQGSGNLPANYYSMDDSFHSAVDAIAASGFSDASSGECGYLVQRFSVEHLTYYFRIVSDVSDLAPTVKAVHDIAVFDRRFRAAIFQCIEYFESQLRTQYSHWMKQFHGDYPHLDRSLFLREHLYDKTRGDYQIGERRAKRNNSVIRSIAKQHDDKLPIGYATQTMSLGVLSRFYSNTADNNVTNAVAASFGASKDELSSWLRAITDVRNICAHFGPYLSRKQMPSTPKKILGLDGNNMKPPYIASLLLYLLSEDVPFMDRNLAYGEMMRAEISEIVQPFADYYPRLMEPLGFSDCWELELENAIELGFKAHEKMRRRR